MKVLALSGWKQSGKDSFADFLCDGTSNFKRYGFADILKNMVCDQYGLFRESCDNPELKELPLEEYPATPKDAFSEMVVDFMARELRDLDGNNGGSPRHGPLFWTPRALCILEGSVKRSVNSSYWVKQVIDKIMFNNYVSDDLNYVITDMRYKSEMEQLRDAFGSDLTTIRINRFDNSPSTDPSERDLDDGVFDFQIDNKSNIGNYMHNINELLTKLDIRSERIDY